MKKQELYEREAEFETLSLLFNYNTDFMSDIRAIEKRTDEIKALIKRDTTADTLSQDMELMYLETTQQALKVITFRRYEASLSEIQAIRDIHPEYDWRTHDEYLNVFNYIKKTDITKIDRLEVSGVESAIEDYAYGKAGLSPREIPARHYFEFFETNMTPEQLKAAYDARTEKNLQWMLKEQAKLQKLNEQRIKEIMSLGGLQ